MGRGARSLGTEDGDAYCRCLECGRVVRAVPDDDRTPGAESQDQAELFVAGQDRARSDTEIAADPGECPERVRGDEQGLDARLQPLERGDTLQQPASVGERAVDVEDDVLDRARRGRERRRSAPREHPSRYALRAA